MSEILVVIIGYVLLVLVLIHWGYSESRGWVVV
jgi:hypothetical protein